MPADPAPTIDAVLAALAELPQRIAEAATPSVFVRQEDAPKLLGLSRAAFFRARSLPAFPRPVNLPGAGVTYRRSDLLKWAAGLKPSRK